MNFWKDSGSELQDGAYIGSHQSFCRPLSTDFREQTSSQLRRARRQFGEYPDHPALPVAIVNKLEGGCSIRIR
jgi:hypothetical protein